METLQDKITSLNESGQTDVNLSLLSVKHAQTDVKKQKTKAINDINEYFGNMNFEFEECFNKLGGNNAINSFESKWTQWTIDETLKWFDFVLKNGNIENDDDDYQIEDYTSSRSC